MISRRPEMFWRAVSLGVGAWVVLSLCGSGQAQHTPDPYNIVGEYNSQYEPNMYASYPTMPGTQPNQGRIEGRPGLRNANSFQDFLNSEEDEPGDFGRSAPPPRTGAGTPYYRAYRQFDQEFQRTYRPNETADRNYYTDQEKRNNKYFQASASPTRGSGRNSSATTTWITCVPRTICLPAGTRTTRTVSWNATASARGELPSSPRGRSALHPAQAAPTAPAPRAPLAPAPLASPSARVRTGTTTPTPAPGSSLAPTAPRPGRTLAPAPPPRTGRTTAPSASELLKRSELLDRATRATAPVAPRTPAPAPPPR